MTTNTPTVSGGSGRRRSHLITASLIIAAMLVGGAGMNVYNSYNYAQHDNLGMTGTVTLYVDGKQVYHQQDLILGSMYDMLMCKMWNDSTACSGLGGFYTNFAGSCPNQLTGAGTWSYANNFYGRQGCSMIGVGLTTGTQSPFNSSPYECGGGSPLNSNGLAPVKATTTHSLGSNTITLTATWTASGSGTNGIDAACLYPYDDHGHAVVVPATPTSLVWTQFTSTNLSVGQSFQLQWQFSF